MLTITITATTTTQAIEAAIPFLDMREHAIEQRDMAAAVIDEQGDEAVLELHEIDGATVLFSPIFGYAYVNEMSPGVGDSLLIGNGEADSPEDAAQQWAEALEVYTLNQEGAKLLADWVRNVAKHPDDHNMDAWATKAEDAVNNAGQDESIIVEMRGFMTASGRPETLTLPRTAFDLSK